MVVITLGLWFSAANHCRLESIPGLEFLRCASEADSSSNCESDGCETVENGYYKTESSRTIVPAPAIVVALLSLEQPVAPISARQIEFASAPPELPRIWQFSLRTARLPRAPSVAS